MKRRESKKVWLVFQWLKEQPMFLGVFDTEERALAVCTDRTRCVCPATLNRVLSAKPMRWRGAYYPKHLPFDKVI